MNGRRARGSHSLSIHCTATVISTNTSLSSAAARAFSRRSTSRSVLANGGDGNADGDGDVCRARGLNPFAGADGAAGFARCRWPLAAGRWPLAAGLERSSVPPTRGRAENIARVSTGWQRLTRRSAQPRGDTRSGARDAGYAAPAAGLASCAALGPLAHGAGVRNFVDPSGVRRCSGPLQRNKVWGYRSRHEACATDHHGVQKNTAAAPAPAVLEVAGFRAALNRLGSFLRGMGCGPALGGRSSAQKAAKATGE